MRMFVTGGNGFIGSQVMRILSESGHSVRCLLRKQSNTARIDGLSFERVDGDVRDFSSVRAAMAGCSHAIHLAGIVNWRDMRSREMTDVVVDGTRNVLQAAQESGI